jgi:hypothetical protein
LQKLLIESGRSIDGFGAHCLIMNDQFRGVDAKAAAESICRWADAGGTHASIVTMGRGFQAADHHIDYLNEVRQRLG